MSSSATCGPTDVTVGIDAEPPAGAQNAIVRRADGDHVAVAQPPPAGHPLAADVGPVVGEAVVDERPFVAGALQRGVHARDLGVPVERDVVRRPAADGHAVALRQRDDHLRAVAVAVEQEGVARALRLDPLAQLRGVAAWASSGESGIGARA